MTSDLERLQNFLLGTATPEENARVSDELVDPQSPLSRTFARIQQQPTGEAPDVWERLLLAAEGADASPSGLVGDVRMGTETVPVSSQTSPTATSASFKTRWAVAALIGAATVLLGLILGRWVWPRAAAPPGGDPNVPPAGDQPVPPVRSQEVLVARSSLGHVEVRGTALVFSASVSSDRPGFVTLVSLKDPLPRVYPEAADPFLHVAPDRPASFGPMEAPEGSVVLVIVTETPAQEVIRSYLRPLDVRKLSSKQVRDAALEGLWATGHRWVAMSEFVVRFPKP